MNAIVQRNTAGAQWAPPALAVLLTVSISLWCESAMPVSSESTPQVAAIRRMSLHVGDKKTAPPGTWRVTQGELLRLELTADSPTTVHLHGYDFERQVMPGTPASISFAANTAGRFAIVTHGGSAGGQRGHRERVLLYLEVYPR